MQPITSVSTTKLNSETPKWGAVFAMSFAAFGLVASEFMPVSLLTPIATALQISEGQAGQAISISGAFALLTCLVMTSLIGKLNRRVLLLALAMLMLVSSVVAAFAPSYELFMFGRALIGVAIGGFWSMSAATIMRLVPESDVPRAFAILNGGNALAVVLAAPLGSFLGDIFGWRGAFFFIVPVATITFFWLLMSLPSLKADISSGSGSMFTVMKSLPVTLGLIGVGLFFMGQFALFTYLRPFLESVTKVSGSTLTLLLLTMGVAGFVGTMLIGKFIKNGLYGTLITIPLVMTLITVFLEFYGSSLFITITLLALWGLVATSAPVAWWTWVAKTLPNDAEAGGALMVATAQIGILSGALLGGILYDTSGYQATFALSAGLLIATAIVSFLTARAHKRALKIASLSNNDGRCAL
jgi:predicted MFS family arabinose efflux permease